MQSRSQFYSDTDPTPTRTIRFFRSGFTATESRYSMLLIIGRPWEMDSSWGSSVQGGYYVWPWQTGAILKSPPRTHVTSLTVTGTLEAGPKVENYLMMKAWLYIQSHTVEVRGTTNYERSRVWLVFKLDSFKLPLLLCWIDARCTWGRAWWPNRLEA
jgi:hypothetical protein